VTSSKKSRSKPGTWTTAGLVAVLVGGATVAGYVVGGTDIDNVRLMLRMTARVALVFFLLTFAASSVNRVFGGGVGKWLLRNRRTLGVCFGVAHIIHLGTIGVRAGLHSTGFWAERTVGSLAPGASVYLLILLMMITSTDRTTRWLGRTRWKILHKVGVYAIFGIFAASYSRKDLSDPLVLVPLALLVGVLALRAAARLQIMAATRRRRA